jgi:hypothetical protein
MGAGLAVTADLFPSPPRSGGEGSRVGGVSACTLPTNLPIDPPPPTPPRHALKRAEGGEKRRAPGNDGAQGGVLRLPIISLAAINPPPAISTADIAMAALGFAKPASIRNVVESSGVA